MGEGLRTVKLPQLFQPFNRLGQERSMEEATEIGPMLSKRLVNASAVPKFGAAAAAQPVTAPRTQIEQGASWRTLLYVEDSPVSLKLVDQLISRRHDGDEAIQLVRALQPDVIPMDIDLPGIRAMEALQIPRDDSFRGVGVTGDCTRPESREEIS